MDPAIALYQQGLTPKILITGRTPADSDHVVPEAVRFFEYARERGVPAEAMITEEQATNTKENFVFSRRLIEERWGWSAIRKVAVVCLAFQARRALMTAAAHWPEEVELVFRPVIDERDIGSDTWWQNEAGRHRVLAEIRRIGQYGLQGDLGGL
jgi:uncharacterized SAM-binding protein YcdF (DUF218 family)